MYTNKLHEISNNYLMQAGTLVEKSLHRHLSHFSDRAQLQAGKALTSLTAKSKTKTFIQWNIVPENQTTNMNMGRNLDCCIFSP